MLKKFQTLIVRTFVTHYGWPLLFGCQHIRVTSGYFKRIQRIAVHGLPFKKKNQILNRFSNWECALYDKLLLFLKQEIFC